MHYFRDCLGSRCGHSFDRTELWQSGRIQLIGNWLKKQYLEAPNFNDGSQNSYKKDILERFWGTLQLRMMCRMLAAEDTEMFFVNFAVCEKNVNPREAFQCNLWKFNIRFLSLWRILTNWLSQVRWERFGSEKAVGRCQLRTFRIINLCSVRKVLGALKLMGGGGELQEVSKHAVMPLGKWNSCWFRISFFFQLAFVDESPN